MGPENLYEISLDSASALDTSMERTYDDFSKYLKIRAEMNRLLMNLNYSHHTQSKGQQIHYLFVALVHLDNLEKEINISDVNEEIIQLERIYDKIRSLKKLILEYIRHLTSME
jgi:hypothetical protein